MKLPNFNRIITLILQLFLIGMVPFFLYERQYVRAVAAIIAVFFSLIPALVKRNYKVTMPWLFEFVIALLLLMHLVGLQLNFYVTLWWWDKVAHLLGSAIVGALGFYGVYALERAGKIQVSLKMIALFTFVFAVAIGAVWEIGEYASDFVLDTHNQASNTDTMIDLINDALAGFIVALLGVWSVKGQPEEKLRDEIGKHMAHITEEGRL